MRVIEIIDLNFQSIKLCVYIINTCLYIYKTLQKL